MLLHLFWDPPRVFFTLPIINHPVVWYGVLFAFGFLVGYFLFIHILSRHLSFIGIPNPRAIALQLTDRIVWFVVAGAIIGARLGHVFFYEWPYYEANPLSILEIWKGGLSSHGATLGIIIAVILFWRTIHTRFPTLTILSLVDRLTIPTAFACGCIRIGNFFNQEILGTPSQLPWAVIFGHPADGSLPVPRHPAQLYEAIIYFFTFGLLFFIWKQKGENIRKGLLGGLLFIFIYGSRILIEFLKEPQSIVIQEDTLNAGHLLSIPFVLLGLFLLFFKKSNAKHIY